MLELVPALLIAVATTAVAVLLALVFVWRPARARQRGGALVATLAFVALPGLVLTVGAERHLDQSKTTEFCMSCHEMHPYGASLLQPETLAGAHFANRTVPRGAACYACHTQYTMFGGLAAKAKGVQHLWVHYFGDLQDPLKLYEPYSNRECLHCHEGASSFDDAIGHSESLEQFRADTKSCISCHEPAHGVAAGAVSAAVAGTGTFPLPAAAGAAGRAAGAAGAAAGAAGEASGGEQR